MYKSEVYSDKDPNIYARVVEDSAANNIRLVTLELQMHRFILAQFNTHRLFSRNASSSRAIPVKKNLDKIIKNPAYPIHWGKNQKGMKAKDDHDELVDIILGTDFEETSVNKKFAWELARNEMHDYAYAFMDAGYHKQIVNRLLEPFSYAKVLCTATEFDNFFNLRLHEDSQPEIYELAHCMQRALNSSKPSPLLEGQWHLPYVPKYDAEGNPSYYDDPTVAIKCSVARCARVSSLNHDGSDPDIDKDIKLHDDLLREGHMSPMEHICCPIKDPYIDLVDMKYIDWEEGVTHLDRDGNFWSGNIRGFIQYRQLV